MSTASTVESLQSVAERKQIIAAVESESETFSAKCVMVIVLVVRGLTSFIALALFYYQTTVLNLSPALMQLLSGVISLCLIAKPVFGFAFDRLMRVFGRAKYILIITGALRGVCISSVYFLPPNVIAFTLICVVAEILFVMENVCCYYALHKASKKGGKQNYLILFPACRVLGSIAGTAIGGNFTATYGAQKTFLVGGAFPLAAALATLLARERPAKPSSDAALPSGAVLRAAFADKRLARVLAFNALVHFQPSFGFYHDCYMKDHYKVTKLEMTNMKTIPKFFSLAGLAMFAYVYPGRDLKKLYMFISAMLALGHLSFLFVTHNTFERVGVSPKAAAIAHSALLAAFEEGRFLPLMTLWCGMIPAAMEGTFIAIFTGLSAVAENASHYFGAAVLYAIGSARGDYVGIDFTVLVKSAYLAATAVAIFFIDFDVGSETRKRAIAERV